MIVLKAKNKLSRPLTIKLFPQSAALKHRQREDAVIEADSLNVMFSKARTELVKQIAMRFIDKRFSDARLIQIYMLKQMDAAKVLSEDNLQIAKALYLQWLRALLSGLGLGNTYMYRMCTCRVCYLCAPVCVPRALYCIVLHSILFVGAGTRTSPRKKKKKGDLFAGLDSDEDEPGEADSCGDRLREEVKVWENLSAERVAAFKDNHGLVNEFKLLWVMRKEVPLHKALFQHR